MRLNRKGAVLYFFLLLFFLLNFALTALLMDFFLFVEEDKLHLDKARARMMAENAFEEGLAQLYGEEEEGLYFLTEESFFKIKKTNDNEYLLESQARQKEALAKTEAKIEIEEDGLHILYKKIY